MPSPPARALAGVVLAVPALLLACSSDDATATDDGATRVHFDLAADTDTEEGFYGFPQPSDLRLDANGAPSFDGLPNPRSLPTVTGLRAVVGDRRGFSVLPVGYFAFDAPLAARDLGEVIAAAADSPILLLDVDPDSPERGRLLPTVATVLPPDDYVPDNLLAVAARPGFVLAGGRRYAFVVRRGLGDETGAPLGVPPALSTLAVGAAIEGERGAAAEALYRPLWETLDTLGVDRADVAAATVFTTGDVMAEQLELVTALRERYSVTIEALALDDGLDEPTLCVLKGRVRYPQFQTGTPPFSEGGLFELGDDGLPVKQRDEDAPVVISIPRRPMPAAGYPLEVFVHGSGGFSDSLLAPLGDLGVKRPGQGPAYVLAPRGIAVAGSAMPVNPERFPGASSIAYINPDNVPMTRDVFRQGVIEQLLFHDALAELSIPAGVLAGCEGATLPEGETSFRFDEDRLAGAGQSMGAWYTNLIAPLQPRMQVVTPTGAGGFLTLFLTTAGPRQVAISSLTSAIGPVLFGIFTPLTFVHPAAALAETALEPADPIVGQPRIAARPLPGMPSRSVYTPLGEGDSYFSTETYEAVQLAYGNEAAGEPGWPGLQEAISLDGRTERRPYPVANNRTSAGGDDYTGVFTAWNVQGYDPHALYQYNDDVKHQLACFIDTSFRTGVATLVAPAPVDAPCE